MDIKKISDTALLFMAKRLTEIFGILISFIGVILLISLISYSPEDPNFIFPDNTEIKNLLGFRGSYISDFFFQSIGLISYLFSITLIFTGLNMMTSKDFFLIIENIFYSILYSIFGSLFFSYFYNSTFVLFINGNGGFVGNYLSENIFRNLILFNETIAYYLLVITIFGLFLMSINFSIKKFITFLKTVNLFTKKEKNYTDKSELIDEYIPQEEIKNLIQEDLPFIKADEIQKKRKIKI